MVTESLGEQTEQVEHAIDHAEQEVKQELLEDKLEEHHSEDDVKWMTVANSLESLHSKVDAQSSLLSSHLTNHPTTEQISLPSSEAENLAEQVQELPAEVETVIVKGPSDAGGQKAAKTRGRGRLARRLRR